LLVPRADNLKLYPLITSPDPVFITPEIKTIVRRKNRLMRKGKIEEASACPSRVGRGPTRLGPKSWSRKTTIFDLLFGRKTL